MPYIPRLWVLKSWYAAALGYTWEETAQASLEDLMYDFFKAVEADSLWFGGEGGPVNPGAIIDDDEPADNRVYSSAKVESLVEGIEGAAVDTAVTTVRDSAPSALDSLNKLASAIGFNQNFSTQVNNAILSTRPVIYAISESSWPNRAAWIAANRPGYTGPVEWDGSRFPSVAEPNDPQEADLLLDRV